MSWDLARGVAVVTGAASGIGRALTLELARKEMSLALCDIDASGLEETAAQARSLCAEGCSVTTHVADVADPVRVHEFADEVLAAHGRVTLLINNAGVALHGTFEELSLRDIDWLMRINFGGVVNGTKAFLPHLRREKRAHIVNLSSIFGIIAPAGQTAYCASKFAIRGFSEALRHELEGTGVGVSVVHPGGIRTRIAARARVGSRASHAVDPLVAEFDRLARNTPEYAATRIVRGVKRNEPRILIGADAHALATMQKLMPVNYWKLMRRGLQKQKPV